MQVIWKNYEYSIYGAKFGHGFFISWWLLYKNSIWKILISRIPVIGDWLAQKLYPVTYYRIDTASMFMTYAQRSVLKVIDDITKEKGSRALTESERRSATLLERTFELELLHSHEPRVEECPPPLPLEPRRAMQGRCVDLHRCRVHQPCIAGSLGWSVDGATHKMDFRS